MGFHLVWHCITSVCKPQKKKKSQSVATLFMQILPVNKASALEIVSDMHVSSGSTHIVKIL